MAYLSDVNPQYGYIRNHLHGNNGLSSCGWQIGTRYKVLDNLSVGAVYKSKIDTRVKGHSNLRMPGYVLGGAAAANLDIPQSIAAGINWDITSDWHLGAMVSWTDWSSLDTLLFHLPASQGNKNIKLNWHDSWRVGIAPSWDFAKDWTAVVSYVYDTNVCAYDQQSTMLPPGDRQIVGGGISWRITQNLQLDVTYALVIMDTKSMHMSDALGRNYRMECRHGLSHAGGCTLTYRF